MSKRETWTSVAIVAVMLALAALAALGEMHRAGVL
jgi:preprotein translocase subunit SecE